MNAAKLDLEFDKNSWLRAEFQFLKPNGDLQDAEEYQYRFIAKESLETDVEIYNFLMPIIPFDGNEDVWMSKVEIYKEASNIDPDFVHYVIQRENPVEGNEDSDEILVYGQLKLNKRI